MAEGLLRGFAVLLTVQNFSLCLQGAVLGTLVGVLPGLGPATTIALLLPLSLKLEMLLRIGMLPQPMTAEAFERIVWEAYASASPALREAGLARR